MENIVQGQWFRGPSADLGDEISQSLRFSGAQKLSKTSNDTSTGSTSGTISVWYKVGKIGSSSLQTILVCGDSSSRQLNATYNSSDFRVPSCGTSEYDSRGPLRDVSAWYHIVTSWDSSNTDAWINGVHQGTKSTTQSDCLRASEFFIGDADYAPSPQFFHGYLAAFYVIEGTKLTHTDFGRYNTDGVWVPVTPTISSYGTNGFHLTFDSSQTNGIGHDSSGNGNHFTASGFETTALSSSNYDNDIDYEDTPTNNFAVLNPHIKQPSSHSHSEALLRNTDTNGNYPNPDPSTQILKGKKYWEVEFVTDPGGSYPYIGICKAEDIQSGASWYSSGGGGFYFSGNGYGGNWVSLPTNTIGATTTGDVLGVAFDRDTLQCTFTRNGGTGQTVTADHDGDYCAMILNAVSESCRINFGQRPFRHTPPTGYTGLATNNLPEPTIKNGKDHFDVHTYTSASTAANISFTGWEFQPDLVWIKSTSHGSSHNLFDSVRGVNKSLKSNNDSLEGSTVGSLTSFDSNGFSLGTADSDINYNSRSFVAWGWKAGGAPTATNSNSAGTAQTAGSVKVDGANGSFAHGTIKANKMSVNTDAGFSIVQYTGTQTAGSIPHGLGAVPEMAIVKRTDAAGDWHVYHKDLAGNATRQIMLNQGSTQSGESSDYWNNTLPTSTTLTLGGATQNNTSGGEYNAYIWTSIPGYSKFGGYTGNSNSDGTFIYLGFKPAFLMVRVYTGSGNFMMWDTARSPNNPIQNRVLANLANAEGSYSSQEIDIFSNGFKLRGTDSDVNAGYNYIYMAFAENPFGGENQPPATAR